MATPGVYAKRNKTQTGKDPGDTHTTETADNPGNHEEAEEGVGSKQDRQGQHHVVGGMLYVFLRVPTFGGNYGTVTSPV